MKSKFKTISYFILTFFIFFIGFLVIILVDFKTVFNSKIAGSILVLLIFFSAFLIFIELKDKIIAIILEHNSVIINRFCGLTNPVFFYDKEIEGFHNSIVTTRRYGRYNYIYLMKGNKKIAKISNQYHKNFGDLSREIEKKYKNLGFINSNFMSELKDMF
jgi:phosphorylcholine metabolism protein LicD